MLSLACIVLQLVIYVRLVSYHSVLMRTDAHVRCVLDAAILATKHLGSDTLVASRVPEDDTNV